MGQYHQFMNFDKKEMLKSPYLNKLTEFSFQRNHLLLQIEELLKTKWKGDRVLVIGDYAPDYYDNNKSHEILKQIRQENQSEQSNNIYFYKYKKLQPKSYSDNKCPSRYIYNHNRKEYIDLKKQPVQWIAYDEKKNSIYGCKIHPLSLLLSCCNGKNGGDYFGKNNDDVGLWINDSNSIEFSNILLPLKYIELDIRFDELMVEGDNIERLSNFIVESIDIIKESNLHDLNFSESLFLNLEEKREITKLVLEKIKEKEIVKKDQDLDEINMNY